MPASDGWPDEVTLAEAYQAMADDIGSMRADGLDGFDLVVIGNADGTVPGVSEVPDYVEAGATWMLVQAFTVEDARARIEAGPLA
ncbi:MAG: hypothetical protein ACRD2W_02905 [Acidimicrobiales bacterium]